jgi:hypothetical protein
LIQIRIKHVFAGVLLACSAIAGPAVLAHGEDTISLKVFGTTGPIGMCTGMGSPHGVIETRQWHRRLAKLGLEPGTITLNEWLAKLNRPLKPQDQKLFENADVSYLVTFSGKSDIGTAKLMLGSSELAQKRALELLQQFTPMESPPNVIPYERRLVIKFRGSKMWVHLAPKHLRTSG